MAFKITFVGCGSAFNKKDGQTNILIESGSGKKMLIDCGTYASYHLQDLGIGPHNYITELDAIFLSHQHADHIGGIEEIAFCSFFHPLRQKENRKIKLYCESNLMQLAWETSLKGGLGSIEGKVMHLTDYFDCKPQTINHCFQWENLKFQMVQTIHVMNGFGIVPSFGLMLYETSDKSDFWDTPRYDKIFLTMDTQFAPSQLQRFYYQCNVIFHDCETSTAFKSKVHSHYDDLNGLDLQIKQNMWLMHYQLNPTQDAIKDGFRGFVQKGQVFEF